MPVWIKHLDLRVNNIYIYIYSIGNIEHNIGSFRGIGTEMETTIQGLGFMRP